MTIVIPPASTLLFINSINKIASSNTVVVGIILVNKGSPKGIEFGPTY